VNIYQKGNFDDVAFGGQSRANLTAILRRILLLKPEENISEKIRKDEIEFAFGSLVRCSLARWNAKKNNYETSGALIKKSFKELPDILRTCTQAFLFALPERTRLIVILGVDDGYIRECQKLVYNLYPKDFRTINEVAYGTPQHLWVHVTHPSPGNGTRNQWLSGPEYSTSGRKRELALQTIVENGLARV
jgi:hypothetical protein